MPQLWLQANSVSLASYFPKRMARESSVLLMDLIEACGRVECHAIYSDCTASSLSNVDRITDHCVVFREEHFEMVCVCT